MERSVYHQLAAIEDGHWWFIYRRRLMAHMIEAAGGLHGEAALDIGCGTGGNLPFLKNYCATVSGIDLSEDAIALARKKFPDGNFRRGDLNSLNELYPAGSFDLISDFSVLYHAWVKSDLKLIRDVYQLLRPGGIFIATEPAFSFLRRAHDVLDHGARRYTLSQLTRMLEDAGFYKLRATYFNLPAFPIALLLALLDRTDVSSRAKPGGVSELKPPPRWLHELLTAVLGLELGAIKAFGCVSLGVTVACVARKPAA